MSNPEYLFDANIIIQAANEYFARVPSFWKWLGEEMDSGRIRTISMVAEEVKYPTSAAEWIKSRDETVGYIDISEPDVQAQYRICSDWIFTQHYKPEQIEFFMSKADLWLISAAVVYDITLVTHEKYIDKTSTKIRIPNICEQFGVTCINTFEMLEEIGVTL